MSTRVRKNPEAQRLIGSANAKFLVELTEETTANAKRFTPKLTGHNSRTIFWEKLRDWEFRVSTASGYGVYIDQGTVHIKGAFYMARAYTAARRKIQRSGPWD